LPKIATAKPHEVLPFLEGFSSGSLNGGLAIMLGQRERIVNQI
jgi:hypothetical protein